MRSPNETPSAIGFTDIFFKALADLDELFHTQKFNLRQLTQRRQSVHLEKLHHQEELAIKQFKERHAAKILQRYFRLSRFNEAVKKNAYQTYLNLYPSTESAEYLLSQMMFGRRHADINSSSSRSEHNPYSLNDRYHRAMPSPDAVTKALFTKITGEAPKTDQYRILPIRSSTISAISTIWDNLSEEKRKSCQLLSAENCPIQFLVEPFAVKTNNSVVYDFAQAGLTASLWDIAISLEKMNSTFEHRHHTFQIPLYPDFNALYASRAYRKMQINAKNRHSATQVLAQAALDLLKDPTPLSSDAIGRIGLFIDLANHIYTGNYSGYAFLIYVITHEISLALRKMSISQIQTLYQRFDTVCKDFFKQVFRLSINLEKQHFLSLTSKSGTNASYIAVELAKFPFKATGQAIRMRRNRVYYELEMLIKQAPENSPLDIRFIDMSYHINDDAHSPLDEINSHIYRTFKRNSGKHFVLIIETTSSDYKQTALAPDLAQKLEAGEFSLILASSAQKFDTNYSDQFQGGRVIAYLSKTYFPDTLIEEYRKYHHGDLSQHLDLLISSYVYATTEKPQLKIRENTFNNAVVFRKALEHSRLASQTPPLEPHYLFYLLDCEKQIAECVSNVLERRSGFGFSNLCYSEVSLRNGQQFYRICPNGSDFIDTLIEAYKLRLYSEFYRRNCHNLIPEILSFFSSLTKHHKTQEDNAKICVLALSVAVTITYLCHRSSAAHEKQLDFPEKENYPPQADSNALALAYLLALAEPLKNRRVYYFVYNYMKGLEAGVKIDEALSHPYVLPAFQVLLKMNMGDVYSQEPSLCVLRCSRLSKDTNLCKTILALETFPFANELIVTVLKDAQFAKILQNHWRFLKRAEQVLRKLEPLLERETIASFLLSTLEKIEQRSKQTETGTTAERPAQTRGRPNSPASIDSNASFFRRSQSAPNLRTFLHGAAPFPAKAH